MKHRIIAIAGALTLAAMLTACSGNDKPAQESASAAKSEQTTTSESEQATVPEDTGSDTKDAGNNTAELVIIEMGDADAIEALAKQAQNFEVAEGTPVQIHGYFAEGVSTPAVQEQKDDGSYIGISLYVDGDWEAPADKTEINVEGAFVKGQYFMELHAAPEDITVVAASDAESGS